MSVMTLSSMGVPQCLLLVAFSICSHKCFEQYIGMSLLSPNKSVVSNGEPVQL